MFSAETGLSETLLGPGQTLSSLVNKHYYNEWKILLSVILGTKEISVDNTIAISALYLFHRIIFKKFLNNMDQKFLSVVK